MSDRPTVATETARVETAALRYGLTLPEIPFADDTPDIVRPAACLFAALVAKVVPYGIDPMPLLADARHGATLAALERSTAAIAEALTYPSPLGPEGKLVEAARIDAGLVELDALRRVEGELVNLAREVEREVRKQALEVSREDVGKIIRGANGHAR